MTLPQARLLAVIGLVMMAGPAYAHAPIPGIKGFYVGLLHPFSTPAQALVMLGTGLLVAGYAEDSVRWLLAGFLACSLLGVIFGSADSTLDPTLFGATVLICSFTALLPGRLLPAALVLVGGAGLLIGSASIPDDGPTRDRLFTTSGSIVGASLGLLYLFGILYYIRKRAQAAWLGIVVRVVAAWIGAVAMLMLALGTMTPT
ncbi:HupE/UreJ family protein [Shimia sp. SDUM112013]|uniref:HupE/UreJ family protein n=1 Tax=Shimia sp. SDUM112013 TaxID=3136160 RepID=UPI0032ED87C9